LFEVRGIYDKDRGTAMVSFGGAAGIAEYVNDRLHVLLLHADEQRGVASPQEAAGTGNAGDAIITGYQLFDHRASIYVTDDRNNQLHGGLASQLLETLDVEHVNGRASYLRLDHHRLNFEERRFDVSRDESPAGVATLADEL
jgi:hypothetical protein